MAEQQAKKQQTVYEGRRVRQDSVITALNDLNEKDTEWHYAVAESMTNADVEDSVAMLERDRFEVVPEEEAAKLGISFGASSRRKLMRVAKGQSDAYRKEALEMARVNSQVVHQTAETVLFRAPDERTGIVTIGDK